MKLGVKPSFKILAKNAKKYFEDEEIIQLVNKAYTWTVVFHKDWLRENELGELEKIKKNLEKIDVEFDDFLLWKNLIKKCTSEATYHECEIDVSLLKKILDFIKRLHGKYSDKTIKLVLSKAGDLKVVYDDGFPVKPATEILRFYVGSIKNDNDKPTHRIKIGLSVNYLLDVLRILGDYEISFLIPENEYPVIGLNNHRGFIIAQRIEK